VSFRSKKAGQPRYRQNDAKQPSDGDYGRRLNRSEIKSRWAANPADAPFGSIGKFTVLPGNVPELTFYSRTQGALCQLFALSGVSATCARRRQSPFRSA